MSIVIIVVLLIVVIVVVGVISISNNLKRLNTSVEQAKADIEIYMVKRYDVIMNSMNVVKEFIKHEDEVFSKLIQIRQGMNLEELGLQASIQEEAGRGLLALGEAYPELKSQAVFVQLQTQLEDQNEHYAAAKRAYNSNVSRYNQTVVVFPNSIVASMQGFKELPFFKDEYATVKKEADIKF